MHSTRTGWNKPLIQERSKNKTMVGRTTDLVKVLASYDIDMFIRWDSCSCYVVHLEAEDRHLVHSRSASEECCNTSPQVKIRCTALVQYGHGTATTALQYMILQEDGITTTYPRIVKLCLAISSPA